MEFRQHRAVEYHIVLRLVVNRFNRFDRLLRRLELLAHEAAQWLHRLRRGRLIRDRLRDHRLCLTFLLLGGSGLAVLDD